MGKTKQTKQTVNNRIFIRKGDYKSKLNKKLKVTRKLFEIFETLIALVAFV